MKVRLQDVIFWILLPMLNFVFFVYIGMSHNKRCDAMDKLLLESIQELEEEQECEMQQSKQCSPTIAEATEKVVLEMHETFAFEYWRSERLAPMDTDIMIQTYIKDAQTAVLRLGADTECTEIKQHLMVNKPHNCFAVAYVSHSNISYNVARVDQNIDHYGLNIENPDKSQIDKYSFRFALNKHNEGKMWPSGFFRKVPKERGRERTKDKLGIFLEYFEDIQVLFRAKLEKHGIEKGDDLVVMVVNEGEIDLFLNFACSCRLHDISLNNIMVFAGDKEVLPMIEATGAMALYHMGFAAVSKKASQDYLDRVFVDMMWYKAFSVYLVLRMGINVLFQDVDLVWFKDPMPYFHDFQQASRERSEQTGSYIEAFFSDDGQRSMRYTPFYANSGFYYLTATERSVYFAWSIMIAMDTIQVLGSHQNVFTTRLVEGLALSHQHTKILDLKIFPTGIMYHHHRNYMKRFHEKKEHPYGFHMCWTQGKPQKLVYFRKSKMWYLTETCSPLEALQYDTRDRHQWKYGKNVPGNVYAMVQGIQDQSIEEQWNQVNDLCCTAMPGAP